MMSSMIRPIFLHNARVTAFDVHPWHPWIACALETGIIKVFNIESGELVYQYSTVEEVGEKEPVLYKGTIEEQEKSSRKPELKVAKKAIGTIKVLKFIDIRVRIAKYQEELSMKEEGIEKVIEKWEEMKRMYTEDNPNLLVACGEHRACIFDYTSYEFKELEMQGTKATCAELLAVNNQVAFGFADGSVILWDVVSNSYSERMATKSKKQVVILKSYIFSDKTYLVSVTADGTWNKWEIGNQKDGMVLLETKVCKYDIYDACLELTKKNLLLLTSQGIIKHNYHMLEDTGTFMPPHKMQLVSICHLYGTHLNNTVALISKEGRQIFCYDFRSATPPRPIYDISMLSKGNETIRGHKFQSVKTYSYQPRLVITSSHSLMVAEYDRNVFPNFCRIPVAIGTYQGPTQLYYCKDSSIYMISLKQEKNILQRKRCNSRPVKIPLKTQESLSKSRIEVSVSPTGRYATIFYSDHNQLEIYLKETWSQLSTMNDVFSPVWAPNAPDRLAWLQMSIRPARDDKKRRFFTYALSVKAVGEPSPVLQIDLFEFPVPQKPILHSGYLLSLHFIEPDQRHSCPDSDATLYTWTGQKIKHQLPAPLSIHWNASSQYMLVCYQKFACLFSTNPKMHIVEIIYDQIISCLWYFDMLFYLTNRQLKCLFAHPSNDIIIPMPYLDSLSSHPLSNLPSYTPYSSIAGICCGHILLFDFNMRLFQLPLNSMLFQFCSRVDLKRPNLALPISNLLPPNFRPFMASFLVSRGYAHLLQEFRIPPEISVRACLKYRQLSHASQLIHDITCSFLDSNSTLDCSKIIALGRLAIHLALITKNKYALEFLLSSLSKLSPDLYSHLALFLYANHDYPGLSLLHQKLLSSPCKAISSQAKCTAAYISNFTLISHLKLTRSYPEFFLLTLSDKKSFLSLWNTSNASVTQHLQPPAPNVQITPNKDTQQNEYSSHSI
ncbi:uncharacterized protein LOC126316933 [Schistocerca gregaria]|uniref:uncharacterized protein LOC126316933 n=1 Tax=Schistocerca gregaria TaxID=7010 RepID=UPI00211DAD16|nr:uncharacterized protein LOC126316933 [Schistocerca gregaria]